MTEAYQCDECKEYAPNPPRVSVSVREALLIDDDGTRPGIPPELEGLDGDYCYRCAIDKIGTERGDD